MRTFASRIIGTAAIAEVPATRNKVKEQYCAARWREAGWIPADQSDAGPPNHRVGNKSSVVQDRQFIVDRQGGPSYRSKKLRHDTIAPS